MEAVIGFPWSTCNQTQAPQLPRTTRIVIDVGGAIAIRIAIRPRPRHSG